MHKNLQPKTKAVINKVQISANTNQFLEDISSINQTNVYEIKALALKIISKILPAQAIFEETERLTKIEYEGVITEILPDGREISSKGQNLLYKIVGQVFETQEEAWKDKKSEFYFKTDTFNIVQLDEGRVLKQWNLQLGNEVINFGGKAQEKLEEPKKEKKIQNEKRNYMKSQLKKQTQEKVWGYNQLTFHNQTNANLSDDKGLKQQLSQILSKIGIIVELKVEKIDRKQILNGPVQIINPNRTIQKAEFKNHAVIKAEDLDYQVFYFTNPELLPVFLAGTTPEEIILYNQKINQEMEQIRKTQKENKYEEKYNVLSKQFVKNSKIYMYEGQAWNQGLKYAIQWLRESGFDVTHNLKFAKDLRSKDYDIIWVSSGGAPLSDLDVSYIVEKYRSGVGLFLWGDNAPYYVEANQILARIISPNYQLQGNYQGEKILVASKELGVGKFDMNHPVSSGFATLHEGHTICHPSRSHQDMQVFAYNTNPNKQESLVYRKPKENEGYLWVDNGFTKYMKYNEKTFNETYQQVRQYIFNVCCTIMRKRML